MRSSNCVVIYIYITPGVATRALCSRVPKYTSQIILSLDSVRTRSGGAISLENEAYIGRVTTTTKNRRSFLDVDKPAYFSRQSIESSRLSLSRSSYGASRPTVACRRTLVYKLSANKRRHHRVPGWRHSCRRTTCRVCLRWSAVLIIIIIISTTTTVVAVATD